jgi:hypothetical protein
VWEEWPQELRTQNSELELKLRWQLSKYFKVYYNYYLQQYASRVEITYLFHYYLVFSQVLQLDYYAYQLVKRLSVN